MLRYNDSVGLLKKATHFCFYFIHIFWLPVTGHFSLIFVLKILSTFLFVFLIFILANLETYF